MMTHVDAFLQDIAMHPEEETLRLVYADWLEDHGEETFAEFIRVQVQMKVLREDHARWMQLRERAEHLLRVLWQRWGQDSPNLSVFSHLWSIQHFRLGLLDKVRLSLAAKVFVEEAPRWIFLVRMEHLTPVGEIQADFFACPQLWRVQKMNCEGCYLSDEALEGFINANQYRRLQAINFSRNQITAAGVASLTRCPSFTGLLALSLSENDLGDEGVRRLVSSPICRNLLVLTLDQTELGNVGADAIAHSPHLRKLRILHLMGNALSPQALHALRSSPSLAKLEHLVCEE